MKDHWRARHFRTGQLLDVFAEAGYVTAIEPARDNTVTHQVDWIAPAFFDMQVNGAQGVNFTSDSLTIDGVAGVTAVCRKHGTAEYLPTVVTSSEATLRYSLRAIATAVEQVPGVRAAVPGIHLEGPWIAGEDGPRGAHPREHVRVPDVEEFHRLQESACGLIKLVTLAPELPGALSLIAAIVRQGVRVAIGHTLAGAQQIRAAVNAGATMSTHLGNGCGSFLPRDNSVMAQLANDGLLASVIVDGSHVPDAVVALFARIKSAGNLILVSDVFGLAGLPSGRYELNGRQFDLADNKITVAGTKRLAGAGVFLDACVGRTATIPGIGLADAVTMASATPRRYMGLPQATVSKDNPVVLFDYEHGRPLRVRACYRGIRVSSASTTSH